jgi:hypothetical protein
MIFVETWNEAALSLYNFFAILVTTYQVFVWVILLVSDYRALGPDFTELVNVGICKLLHIP